MRRAEVVKIDGAPGTGKTHTLRTRLQEEARQGLGPMGFYWLTFTNAGRTDVEPEIREVFADSTDTDPADRAKTFHGLSLSLVMSEGVIAHETMTEQVITQRPGRGLEHYQQFCAHQGMTYDPDYANPRKLLRGGASTSHTGNLLFAINDYLTQTMKPPEQWRAAPVDIPISGDRVVALLEAWREYKHDAQDLRLFEHGDYIKEAITRGLVPAVNVLLVDEFQDLAPLEYKLFKAWRDSGQVDRIYIAGDPEQAIYSFRGGTPHYFEHTDADESMVLKESWRCPTEIAKLSGALLDAHAATDPHGFAGHDSGGTVAWRPLRDRYDLREHVIDAARTHSEASTSAFLLTRTNAQLKRLTDDFREVGLPFEVLGNQGSVWDGDLRQILQFLTNYDTGASGFADPNLRTVLDNLPNGAERRKHLGDRLGDFWDRAAVAPAFRDCAGAKEIVSRLEVAPWKRDVLRNALAAPADLSPQQIRVGTIHTAKGLEAPRVYLFATSTDKMVQRYSRDAQLAAEEHRAYYVGATRASQELVLVTGYFDGPMAPPLEKVRDAPRVVA